VPTLDRLLVPIDFSPSSRAALEYAAFLAEKAGAALEVLHVWEPAGITGPASMAVLQAQGAAAGAGWSQTREGVRRDVERFVTQSPARGRVAAVRVEAGEPSDGILEAARASRADLIVMGTHGRTGIARLLLGSVAEAVLRRATCPVLTVRGASVRTGSGGPPL
jgi:nucleotide-binding universal stress UspA family protein